MSILWISNIWQLSTNWFKPVQKNFFWSIISDQLILLLQFPVRLFLVRNYGAKFGSQNYWLDIIQKLLSLWMFFGIQLLYNLKLEIWLSHLDYNTKIHFFVQELICQVH